MKTLRPLLMMGVMNAANPNAKTMLNPIENQAFFFVMPTVKFLMPHSDNGKNWENEQNTINYPLRERTIWIELSWCADRTTCTLVQ